MKNLILILLLLATIPSFAAEGQDGSGGNMFDTQDHEVLLRDMTYEIQYGYLPEIGWLAQCLLNWQTSFPGKVITKNPPRVKDLGKFVRDFWEYQPGRTKDVVFDLTFDPLKTNINGKMKDADALNFKSKNLILINTFRFSLLTPRNKMKLIIHEILGLAGYESSFQYDISEYLITTFMVGEYEPLSGEDEYKVNGEISEQIRLKLLEGKL